MFRRLIFRRALARPSFSTAIILFAALLLAVAVQMSPVGSAIDRALEQTRFQLLSRPASGKVVIVEMDAASTAAIARWPWPRRHYVGVVDQLRRAGAASIVFDVDLSSASTPSDDAALAAALARADGLAALPTFGQQARSNDRRNLDAMPLPLFRPHVALASVSIAPDGDGLVRHAPLGTVTYGVPHPSLSAYIAHRSGSADEEFPVDYAILPDGIARLSFVAVRDGHFDPALVRGRDVLIGATAIEMGDRYATPRWGNLPGVVIQALAAETLLRGVPHEGNGSLAIPLALLLALPILLLRRGWLAAVAGAVGLALLFVVVLAVQAAGFIMPLAGAATLLVTASAGRIARDLAARFQRQRHVDEDSGLPNRRALLASRDGAGDATLLVLAVANYEDIAAVLPDGGAAQLMARLADRLRVAADAEAVYRIGEQGLAVELMSDDAAAFVQRLRATMLAPVEVAGRRVDAAVSFGIGPAGLAIDRQLSGALLAAEQAARSGVPFLVAGTDLEQVEQGMSLMGELDEALAAGRIIVHYQPKLAIRSDTIVGAEALVRWRTPDGRFISPATFVPLAEQANRIGPLTLFVLETVLADLARWRAAGERLVIAVNISARLLGDAGFDAAVEALLARAGVPTGSLVFEVTESAALADPDAAIASLERFHRAGIALSMDDYGTGQSTLTYLRRLPLTELKIDRSFVQHAATDRKDAAMVRSTVDLAHELGLKVVAEGIEDEDCLAFLRAIGCDVAQGYLIGKPMPADAFITRCVEFRAAA